MKGNWKKAAAFLCVLFVLTGCIRVVNEVNPGAAGNMDITNTEDGGTAGGARTDDEAGVPERDGEDAADEGAEEKVRLKLSEELYDEVKQIAANEYFAVREGDVWGVVDARGRVIYPSEYDFIETDGNGLFSLTKQDGSLFDARVMYYDARTGSDAEVFTNEQYPDYDFVEFYTPYITMSARGNDRLEMMYVQADHFDGFDFDFYRLSGFDRIAIRNAGMDETKWDGASGFMANMTSYGGSFVSAEDWAPDGAGYTNVIGIDGENMIVLSEIERGRTLQILPYTADDQGYYAAYIVELPSAKKTLAYGNMRNLDFAAAGLTAFPSDAEEVIPDLSSGTSCAGRNGRAVIADHDGDEAIFNMSTGKAETEFLYKSILLSGDSRYPSVARENKKYVYITPEGKTRDTGEPEYAGASLYDTDLGYALVVDADGSLFAIDRNGKRVSAKEEGFADGRTVYLDGGDSHAFTVETDGGVRICILEE